MADIKISYHRDVSRYVTIDEGLRHTTVHDDGDVFRIQQSLHGPGYCSRPPQVLYTVIPRQSLRDALALLENTLDGA